MESQRFKADQEPKNSTIYSGRLVLQLEKNPDSIATYVSGSGSILSDEKRNLIRKWLPDDLNFVPKYLQLNRMNALHLKLSLPP